jgi:hypothetical protein
MVGETARRDEDIHAEAIARWNSEGGPPGLSGLHGTVSLSRDIFARARFSRRSQKLMAEDKPKQAVNRHSPDERRPPPTERHLDSLRKSGGQRKPPSEAERVALLACDMDGRTFIDQQDRWTTTWRCGATTTP